MLSTIKMAIPECEGGEDFLTPPTFYGVHIPSWSVVGMRMVRGLKKKKREETEEKKRKRNLKNNRILTIPLMLMSLMKSLL